MGQNGQTELMAEIYSRSLVRLRAIGKVLDLLMKLSKNLNTY